MSHTDVYFLFGILFNELGAVLKRHLNPPAHGQWPEIVLLADELGKYGAAGAILELMTTLRNVRVRAVCAAHSLMSLHERLRDRVAVLAANRIAGSETGSGAELCARQLAPYEHDPIATVGADGRPTGYWSPEAQLRFFLDRLQNAPDHLFAVRLAQGGRTIWGRPVLEYPVSHLPDASVLDKALTDAIRRSGQPLSELRQQLETENARLDRQFGVIGQTMQTDAVDPDDTSWHRRPDSDFAPF